MIRHLAGGVLLATLLAGAFMFSGDDVRLERTVIEASSGDVRTVINPPELRVSAWGLFDPETGEIVEGKDTGSPLPIASVTKLFTAYAVSEGDDLDMPVTIVLSDLNTPGRAGKLEYGDTLTVRELLFPLLLESSNDAAEALHRVLGERFDTIESELTEKLALKNTRIVDASGLSPENISSVADLARFYAHARKVAPYPFNITKLPMYALRDYGWVNNNPGRDLPGFLGGKHGYTDEAQRTFVGAFAIDESDREVGIVILGSDDLTADITKLLTYAADAGRATSGIIPE